VSTSELGQAIERAQERRTPRTDTQRAIELLNRLRPEIERALPASIRADRLARVIQTELRKNPALGSCDPDSFLGAVLTAAQLGLEPGPLGLVYFNPRFNKNTGRDEVQLTIGYRGYIALALRHPDVDAIDAHPVYANEKCVVTYGSNASIEHTPRLDSNRGALIGAYAIAFLATGYQLPHYLDRDEIEKRRKRATTDKIWAEHYDAMAVKSAVRALNNVLPVSPELQRAEAVDYHAPRVGDVLADAGEVLGDGAVIDVAGSEIGAPAASSPAPDPDVIRFASRPEVPDAEGLYDEPPPEDRPPPTDEEVIAAAVRYDESAEGEERAALDHFINLEELPANHNEWGVAEARAVLEFADRPL
jgi:recombination protein RecT